MILFDTIKQNILNKNISREQIENVCPEMMMALPRLMIIYILFYESHLLDFCLEIKFPWFVESCSELNSLHTELIKLTPLQISELEKMLIGNHYDIVYIDHFKNISKIADYFHSRYIILILKSNCFCFCKYIGKFV